MILSGGEQRGAIFEKVTNLPDNVTKIRYAFTTSTVIPFSVMFLTVTMGALSA